MTKFCDSLVKNINKNHNLNNSINNIPNKNYEIVNNAIFTLDNNKRNLSDNDVIVVNNSDINEVNYSKVNNDDKKNDNDNDNKYEKIKNVKDLNKLFKIGRATGDGNCLFYSLSTATFGSDGYFNEIRNAVCDYMENNDIDDLHDLNKEDYIKI